MKKFLAILFSLIFALSATTVAFASEADLTCDAEGCHAKLADEKAYTAHINGGCLVLFKSCTYCGARVANDKLAAHEEACPKGAGSCEYCGEAYDTQADYKAHKDSECKMINTVGSEDAAKVVNKVIDVIKGIDWEDLGNKVVDAVKGIDFEGIIAKIKPIFEKIVAFITEAIGEAE